MIEGHGDDRHRYGEAAIRADFSSNVPGGIDHTALREHLAAHLSLIGRYPEPEPRTLEAELAARSGLSPENVIATNGATEAIYLVAHLLARESAKVKDVGCAAVVEPTFAEYGDACRLYGLKVETIAEPYGPPAGCHALWCCNPNNPTGRTWERGRLLETIDTHPEIVFVVDQSYEAFTSKPVLSAAEAAARENVVLIHSMTKHYAVPGLRLGYLTAAAALCCRLRRLRMPWSVNALAIEAGRFLLRRGGAGFSLPAILKEAARVAEALRATGFLTPLPTDTHFMLVEMAPSAAHGAPHGAFRGSTGTAAELKEWLACEEGLLVRNADNFHGLTPRHFRIAVQSPAENDLLIEALVRWIRR